jgi:(1->4)-alpha-D-glucan 1-alpha-D-glucosylmutase
MDAGAPKLWLMHRLLHHRRRNRPLYATQEYETMVVTGERAGDVVAFRRDRLAVVIPCRTAGDWSGASVELPSGRWLDVLTGTPIEGCRQPLDQLLAMFPVIVLERDVTS